MFARVFAVLPLVAFVAAQYQCNTGSPNCCNSVGASNSPAIVNELEGLGIGGLLGLLGVAAGADIGLQCTGIVGTGADCTQEPVCCEDNYFSGLVNVGCSPINVV